MALTLVEAAKLDGMTTRESAVVEEFARSGMVLARIPFQNIPGNSLRYNREADLPGIGYRGVNEAYTESTGVLNPVDDPLVIAGGDLDVDRFLVETGSPGTRAQQELMKVKSLALRWELNFIKGDSSSDPRVPDGLQRRLTGPNLIPGTVAGGNGALSLNQVDVALDRVRGANALVMSKAMRRKFSAASRNAAVGGTIEYTKDSFGESQRVWNGVPILEIDTDDAGSDILAFNEAGPDGDNDCTSIYVVNFNLGYCQGIQNGGIRIDDLGLLQTSAVFRTRVEWYSGLALKNSRSAARIYGIENSAITV